MIKSLRGTLLIWLLVPLVVLFSISTLVVYKLALKYSENAYDRALVESANDIKQLSLASLSNSGNLDLPRIVEDIILPDTYDKTFFTLIDERNHVVEGDGKLLSSLIPQNSKKIESDLIFDTIVDGEKVRAVSKLVHFKIQGETRTWRILVGETRKKREMLAKDILTGFVVPQAIVIILAAALVMFGIRRGLAPLNQLRAEIAMRKEKSELTIETKEMPIEVQPVLEEINRLIGRLQAVYDAHKRFTADAAHQLRTPLAGLSAQTDLARAQDNPEATQHALDQIKHASSRLNHAVSQLLSLARNETGSARLLRLEKISLCGLAKEVTMDWVEVAMDRRIDLGFNGSNAPVEVLGDVERIKELLNNLLDNAVRFCPAGSHVTVSVDVDRTLSVEDDGPGIPVAERERIFERFYRVLDNDAEGSGLGLAIVKEIAEMHHCTISLGAGKEGRGALFSVRFPDSAQVSLL